MHIAMWSGPRNLSTAMMYAFGARADCAIQDEPFYATYLAKTGFDHPMRAETLAVQSTDPEAVIAQITGPAPDNAPHFYQKHLTQHMLPGIPRGWMQGMTNVFLIRHPARVIASYAAKRENPVLEDLGFRQQVELFEEVRVAGGAPVVIDSHDIRDNPEKMLRKLCDAIGLTWDPAMLSWRKGGNANDGAWAPHWYGSVWDSTGFVGAEGPLPTVPATLLAVEKDAKTYYDHLKKFKLLP